jgi:hypothetical protein
MKNLCLLSLLILILSVASVAQVSVNTDGSAPDNSAILDVKSSNRGLLPPRMTLTEINAIINPANGLIVFCMDCGTDGNGAFYGFINGVWNRLFSCIPPTSPSSGVHVPLVNQVTWNWNVVSEATGYKWNTTNNYGTATEMGTTTNKTETGLNCNNPYTRYVWSYNTCSISAATMLSQTTLTDPPASPTAGTHVPSQTQIVWNWSTVSGATGYKWNTTDNYSSAIDMGTAITKTETGLTCNTSYIRYVWAYSLCGNSSSLVLNQATSACSSACGTSIQITHSTAGGVAPVNKTVTYGIVTNIPGEPLKCWISSNLGADHQATAVNDNTEPSAGWYWQFNHKQGYKHTGTARTPNSSWITSISENLDWEATKDPCTLELGIDWRIPTATEWTNVDASGNWTEMNGPWNSDLKLHAGGYLNWNSGSLTNRGSNGNYWASKQNSTTSGWNLSFYSTVSYVIDGNKSYGINVRCIRE